MVKGFRLVGDLVGLGSQYVAVERQKRLIGKIGKASMVTVTVKSPFPEDSKIEGSKDH